MFNECRHIKADGHRCRSGAIEGKPYCFFHMKLDRIHKRDRIEIPPIEDSTSVFLALGQVVRALNYDTMECKRAGLMLYGLQIAASVAKHLEQKEPVETVRSIHNLQGEPLEFNQAFASGADMLAPENEVCEPPHDCANCAKKDDSCEKRQAVLQKSLPDHADEEIHDPERAAMMVREAMYARLVQTERDHPELSDGPLPSREEFLSHFPL